MSRQIKFRAFDKDNNRMHYFHNGMQTDVGDWYITFDGKVYQRYGDVGDDFELQNVELMQFSGLLDKNGKEIYEGDIVKSFDENLTVFFNSTMGCWDLQYHGGDSIEMVDENGEYDLEVIGNIYENPELLK